MTDWALAGRDRLGAGERAQIDRLREVCETAEPLDLKLELDETGRPDAPMHQLAFASDRLIGYAGLTNDREPEAGGMVDPAWRRRGVATALLGELRSVARRLDRGSLLFVCEDSGPVALAWMRRLGAVAAASERRMLLRLDRRPPATPQRLPGNRSLEIRHPVPGDREARVHLLTERFTESVDEVEERLAGYEDGESLIVLDAGIVVGTLRIVPSSGRSMIYGLVVDRERRGQGLGSRILATVLDRLRAEGATEIGLEVDPDNVPAVRLYERFGFQTVTTYRYMRLGVA